MSALDSLGKSIGEVVDERMSSPLISSFALAWSIINYQFFVILLSKTPVSETLHLIKIYCFPDYIAGALYGILFPLIAALFYLFVLPKPSQFVYEHWRKLQKWKNDTNYKYDSEAYETLAKSRTQRERINELTSEVKNLNAENEQMRLDAKEQMREIAELKARTIGEEVDALKDVLHNVTQERETYKLELERMSEEFERLTEKHSAETTELIRTVELRQAERAKLQQHLSEAQAERSALQKEIGEVQAKLRETDAKLGSAEEEHLKAVAELELHLNSQREADDSDVSPLRERIIRSLKKEGLVTPSFDDNQLSVLQGVGHNRGATARHLYEILELSNVHIDFCLVELANEELVEAVQEVEYGDVGYQLTQSGRRVYVRADSLLSSV